MKKLVTLIISIILSMGITACTSTDSSQLSKKEKIEDFEYLYNVISEGYPFLEVNKRMNNIDWIANKEKYLKRIKNTKNDEEFISELSSILSDLNNGHTHMINDKKLYEFFKDAYMPTNWYDFLEAEKVVNRYESIGSNDKSTKKPMVKKDVTTKDVVDGKIAYMYLPEMYMEDKDIQSDMKILGDYIQTLENHQALIIDIRENSGGNDLYWNNLVSKITQKNLETKGYMLLRNENEIIKNYADKRMITTQPIAYLPQNLLKNAPKEATNSFDGFSQIDRYIHSDKTSKFEGKIYLLVDEKVFSSSESFAVFCKDTGFATVIAERTGGDGCGIDPVLFDLKNSGILVRMTINMYLTQDGICNEEFKTTPDYIVKDAKRTEKFENDKCIQQVLELEDI